MPVQGTQPCRLLLPLSSTLRSACLLIFLFSVLAQTKPDIRNPAPVPITECKLPFTYNGVEYYGCTSSEDSKPWCTCSTGEQRYCDVGSAAKISSFGKCAEPWQRGDEQVVGCIREKSDQKFRCDAETCGDLSKIASAASASTASKGSNAVILAAVGGVVAVALVAGLFVARRQRQPPTPAAQWEQKNEPYGFPAETGLLAPGVPEGKLHSVISTYTPTLGDELEIQPGDKVSITVEYDDGWCQGINHSRGGAKGVFPKHCVDMSQ